MGREFSKILKSSKKREIAIEYDKANNSNQLSEPYLIRSNSNEIDNNNK